MQSASYRPRRADGTNSNPKAHRLKTQEELIFLGKSEGWKKTNSISPSQSGRRSFLFVSIFVVLRSSTDWIRPIHLREGNLFTQSINSHVTLIQKYPHKHILNNVWPNVRASCGPVKLPQIKHCSPQYQCEGVDVLQQGLLYSLCNLNLLVNVSCIKQ